MSMDALSEKWLDDDLQFMEQYPNGVSLLDMIPFYEMVAKNEPIKLEWVSPGRRDPNTEESQPTTQAVTTPTDAQPAKSELTAKLTEFDFDDNSSQPLPLPVGPAMMGANPSLRPVRHPPRQPRVANMDKILNDLFRSRKDTVPTTPTSEASSLSRPSDSRRENDNMNPAPDARFQSSEPPTPQSTFSTSTVANDALSSNSDIGPSIQQETIALSDAVTDVVSSTTQHLSSLSASQLPAHLSQTHLSN